MGPITYNSRIGKRHWNKLFSEALSQFWRLESGGLDTISRGSWRLCTSSLSEMGPQCYFSTVLCLTYLSICQIYLSIYLYVWYMYLSIYMSDILSIYLIYCFYYGFLVRCLTPRFSFVFYIFITKYIIYNISIFYLSINLSIYLFFVL